MRRFRLIPHTADIGLMAYGHSLAETFANAGYGLFSIMAELRNVKEVASHQVEVSAEDIESLLFEWLNALIYRFEVSGFLCRRFDMAEFTDTTLTAICWGEKYDPLRHHLKLGVKSATYYKIKIDKERHQVQVILDV